MTTTSLEVHIEQLQAFASNAWLDDVNCPCLAIYINKMNKPYTKTYPLSFDTTRIREQIIETAQNFQSEYVFTVYPSKVYICDSGRKVLDSLNGESGQLDSDAQEGSCLVMVLNECHGNLRRIWAAITSDTKIGHWEEYDYYTLICKH